MRLAIIETAPYGGLLHYAVHLGDALAGRGHDVEILAPRGNEMAEHPGRTRMRAVLTPSVRVRGAPPGPPLVRRALVAVRLSRAWVRAIAEVRRGRYDIVVVNVDIDLTLVAAAALLLARLPGGPRVAVVAHSARPLNRWGGEEHHISSPLLARLLSALYRRCAVVLVHGERSRDEFAAAWPGARVAVIAMGQLVSAASVSPEADEPRALFFGVWRKVKGLPVLMDAFDLLAQRRPDARLTVAGAPAPADLDPVPVRRWAAGHGGAVELREGYVDLEDLPELFGRARCLVTPYETAYQSGVVQLALTFGRPTVASDIGDLPEAVGDDAGVLVTPGDPAALADALERVLFDPALAARLGAAARRRAEENTGWDDAAESVEAALAR